MYNSEEDDSRRGSERYAVPASKTQNIVRAIFGIVIIVYGLWRAYRQYKGIDSRL